MPRLPRSALGGYIHHVLNRANGRRTIFHNAKEYVEFEKLLADAKEQFNMRILAYALMPNHWHLLLYPREDVDMANFMRWLTTTHARRFRLHTDTVGEGHVYQGRYKSFVVETDEYLLTVLKYIERNPVRAGLVLSPEEWRWGSAYRRLIGSAKERSLIYAPPTPLPHNYREWILDAESPEELKSIRISANNGSPYGSEKFISQFTKKIKTNGSGLNIIT